jgi:uncharacterized glyoxalase superfamily protein PhnB
VKAYPMPLFVKLAVQDIRTAILWYENILQFKSVFELPNEEGEIMMAHLRGEEYQDIMLVQERNKEPKGKGVVLNLTVEQIEEYYERALSERAVIVEKPIKRPWNAYELLLADYDGYLITLSMRLDQEKGFEEIVKDVIG